MFGVLQQRLACNVVRGVTQIYGHHLSYLRLSYYDLLTIQDAIARNMATINLSQNTLATHDPASTHDYHQCCRSS